MQQRSNLKRRLPSSITTIKKCVQFDVDHNDVHVITSLKRYEESLYWSRFERRRMAKRAVKLARETNQTIVPNSVIEFLRKDSMRGLESMETDIDYSSYRRHRTTNRACVARVFWEQNYCNYSSGDENHCDDDRDEVEMQRKRERICNSVIAYLNESEKSAEMALQRGYWDEKIVLNDSTDLSDNSISGNQRRKRKNGRRSRSHTPPPTANRRPTPFMFCEM